MICCQCNRNLVMCICDDFDERIKQLESSPFLAIDFDKIRAQRFINQFDIEREKQKHHKQNENN